MFEAIEAGEEAAVQFWKDHVEEVKRVVPKDKLLVFEVKQGWGPLCSFLGCPVPSVQFPNVNDTSQIEQSRTQLLRSSWLVVVVLPLLALLGMFLLDTSGYISVVILVGLVSIISFQVKDVVKMK